MGLGVGLALAAAPAEALSFGKAVEAPPAAYSAGPTLTGNTTEMQLDDVFRVQAVCNANLGAPAGGGYYQACYIAALDLVVLPTPRAWPSRREWLQLRAHEWAHARGWRHGDAKITASAADPASSVDATDAVSGAAP